MWNRLHHLKLTCMQFEMWTYDNTLASYCYWKHNGRHVEFLIKSMPVSSHQLHGWKRTLQWQLFDLWISSVYILELNSSNGDFLIPHLEDGGRQLQVKKWGKTLEADNGKETYMPLRLQKGYIYLDFRPVWPMSDFWLIDNSKIIINLCCFKKY